MSAESSRSGEGRVPDFFIVGHAKSGTTALYEMLREHPQVFMPELKEPWYFSSDMRARFQPLLGGPEPETLEEYKKLFAPAAPGQKAGEASSSYLWSQTAAAAIAAENPQARIIAILREPASFLRSLHLQLLQTHVEDRKDLRRAIELEAARREGRNIPERSHRPQLLQYASLVRYGDQLRRYYEHFPREQVLVLIYDDFRADNEGAVREVMRHIGVDAQGPVETLDANPSILMRSQRLDGLVHHVSVGSGGPVTRVARATIKAALPRRVRRGALGVTRRRVVHATPPSADEQLMHELRERFKPQVQDASELLGRDLVALWGYDELD
jgi:hypothetical protein